jgi:hypothetical protein
MRSRHPERLDGEWFPDHPELCPGASAWLEQDDDGSIHIMVAIDYEELHPEDARSLSEWLQWTLRDNYSSRAGRISH